MDKKAEAYQFLRSLHQQIEQELVGPEEMKEQVQELIELGKTEASKKYLCSPEHAFTRGIILPLLHQFLIRAGLEVEEAKMALLTEGWANHTDISSNTPARIARHPFDKAVVSDPSVIYKKWSRASDRLPLTQSCPDFAFREPCPHKIVFEAKFFTKGSESKAQRDLVTDLYQAFFYRGLPSNYDKPNRPWDYDYACLFAYDASSDGAFLQAWNDLDKDVRDGFWHGANVYTMVLRGI